MPTVEPAPFPTIAVTVGSSQSVRPIEPVNDFLAITPLATPDRLRDRPGSPFNQLSAGFGIVHLPTGRLLPHQHGCCITSCRRGASRIAALDVDWSTHATGDEFRQRLQPEALEEVTALLREMDQCRSCVCTPR